jgi:hypothetical protein
MKFGDRNHISFELTEGNKPNEMMNVHFYLGGKLISNETVYLPTYISSFQNLLKRLSEGHFNNSAFTDLPPEQIFARLINERESNEKDYFTHLFQLDETIDEYVIFAFQKGDRIQLIWSCWDKERCNSDHELNNVYEIQFATYELIETVNH